MVDSAVYRVTFDFSSDDVKCVVQDMYVLDVLMSCDSKVLFV